MTAVRETGRWRGIVAVALFFVAVGVLTDRPAVLLAGVVGAGFGAYPHLSGPPAVELDIERRIESGQSTAGDPVEVTTRLTNVGDRTLTDVRIVDGVPPMLTVVSGTPRHAAVLRPGRSTEFTYTVSAEPGRHQFEPATVIARDPTGSHEVETAVSAETEIRSVGSGSEPPLRDQTAGPAGRAVTDIGGSGIEFHTVREYRRGDPMGRIDSKRWARTGELTTVEFREERRRSVLLLVDAREAAYRARADDDGNAVAHSLAGVEQFVESVGKSQTPVGLAAIGREFCWLAPGVGADHEDALRRTLHTHPALSAKPPAADRDGDIETQLNVLRERLGRKTQVVVFSPLTDEAVADAVQTLELSGYAVTVVSPDVTAAETLGQRLARFERSTRVRGLRRTGVPVVDWDPATPLGTVLRDERRRRGTA